MVYYKDKAGLVCAYTPEQLNAVSRLTELEVMISEKEPNFLDAQNNLHKAQGVVDDLTNLLNEELCEDEFNALNAKIAVAKTEVTELELVFNQIELEYQPIKDEFDAVLPVFFDIREHLKELKKMSTKEVEAHLNPPIPKEQLIAEAEQQKQSLLAEANNAIASLQDAVDLNIATEAEAAALQEWKIYRVLLNRVDTSTAPDIEWPEKP
ncbi:tail fiber assembly protein [Providencia huaxiensis]|uniref:tail fiber assembly protein n=1 Tax=Providencia huaxiensis TaxID=2027290 RepID=UPI0024AF4B3B|nr:tail fiber assembly protein [Providencia huaxiensis]MDI7238750.1 tail fiber assembly protein [Providencia huaxiensis]